MKNNLLPLTLALAFSLFGQSLFAQTYNLAPVAQQVFLDSSGKPLNGGKVYTCSAGASCPGTPLASYSDTSGTPNANPIVLNSAGRNTAGAIYLSNVSYKFVVQDSSGNTIYTQDNVATLNTLVPASLGGTGLNTGASNGVPSINSGAWSVNAITQNGVLYGGASNALSFTAAPSSNSVLTVSGGVPTWSATPQFNRLGLGGAADGTAGLYVSGTSLFTSTLAEGVTTNATGSYYAGGNAAIDGFITDVASSTASDAGDYKFQRSGGTQASRSTITNGSDIGDIIWNPYGSSFASRAVISAVVNGTVSGNTIPTDLVFKTGTGGITEAFRLKSDQTAVFASSVTMGVNSATAGGTIMIPNGVGSGIAARNAANNANVAVIELDNANNVTLASGGGDIKWGRALVALGGGAAPTLGTIGGSGPATAAQNTWMRVLDSTGAAFFVPAWK